MTVYLKKKKRQISKPLIGEMRFHIGKLFNLLQK